MPKFKNSNATFWVIFKHCAVGEISFFSVLSFQNVNDFRHGGTLMIFPSNRPPAHHQLLSNYNNSHKAEQQLVENMCTQPEIEATRGLWLLKLLTNEHGTIVIGVIVLFVPLNINTTVMLLSLSVFPNLWTMYMTLY